MNYIPPGLLSLLTLVCIHLFANKTKVLGWIWHGRFLSFAAGISFSYVFIDLLPALEQGLPVLKRTFGNIIPYLDRHTYVISLIGVLFYYGLQTNSMKNRTHSFWVSLSGYLLFNFFVGASLYDDLNPEIQPLLLFTVAMGMHYFIRDHNAREENKDLYNQCVRWYLTAALILGYFVGYLTKIPETISAITVSFIAGGVLLNVLGYELPKREQVGYPFFVLGAALYTVILLSVG